jgi:hypothetical protein
VEKAIRAVDERHILFLEYVQIHASLVGCSMPCLMRLQQELKLTLPTAVLFLGIEQWKVRFVLHQ